MLDRFNQVDHELAKRVAQGLGMPTPEKPAAANHGKKSAALSQEHTPDISQENETRGQ
jgi:catalase